MPETAKKKYPALYLGLNQFRDKELKRIKKALENKEKMIFTGEVEHGGRY